MSVNGRAIHKPNGNRCSAGALITGGAGFIGTNLASRLIDDGLSVTILDNFSRTGVKRNFHWLKQQYGDRLRLIRGDVRDRSALREAVRTAGQVFHFAAQVAVTTSLAGPVEDFDVNARGTLNLLEELRALRNPPPLVFTSTNKVYGALCGLEFAVKRLGMNRATPRSERLGSLKHAPRFPESVWLLKGDSGPVCS